MTFLASWRRVLLCCAVLAMFQNGTTARSTSAEPVVVRVEKSGARVIREAGSKRIGTGATDNLLYLLDDVAGRLGKSSPVFSI